MNLICDTSLEITFSKLQGHLPGCLASIWNYQPEKMKTTHNSLCFRQQQVRAIKVSHWMFFYIWGMETYLTLSQTQFSMAFYDL